MTDLAPGLLQVWNPLIEPLTIKVHVDALLAGAAKDRHVWWGRVFVGKTLDAAAARKKWPDAARLADHLDAAPGRAIVLLVTSFTSLHACKVDRIAFGDAAGRADPGRTPEYVRRQNVGLWFRVRDVRPLSHDQKATLEWLASTTRVPPAPGHEDFGAFGYDPYRAFHYRYPIALETLPVEKLFDPAELGSPPPASGLFAAQAGAAFPPDLDAAMTALKRDLDPPWNQLDESTRVFLASAQVLEALHEGKKARRYAMEPSAAMMLMAKAVEGECKAALGAVHALASRHAFRAAPPALGTFTGLTLGEVARLLPALKETAQALKLSTLNALSGNAGFHGWLDAFAHARNRAAHAERLSVREFSGHREAIYARRTSRLVPLASLKKEALGKLG